MMMLPCGAFDNSVLTRQVHHLGQAIVNTFLYELGTDDGSTLRHVLNMVSRKMRPLGQAPTSYGA